MEKKKGLHLVDPNNTFEASKKAHHPHCKLSQKCKSDEEKAAIEREKQLNDPLQEHKKLNNEPTKADFDIGYHSFDSKTESQHNMVSHQKGSNIWSLMLAWITRRRAISVAISRAVVHHHETMRNG